MSMMSPPQSQVAQAPAVRAAVSDADARQMDQVLKDAIFEDFELDQILYCSLCSEPMTQREIEQLAATASNLNRMDHITGMLMHADGVFVQLIEGPREAINHLWARILRDSRHMGVVQLYYLREVESRVCEGWGMQLVDRQSLQEMIHDARTEIVNGRKTAWAPAIERMDELLSHSDWGVMARDLQAKN
jgi:Sensors of blue-light using FAD